MKLVTYDKKKESEIFSILSDIETICLSSLKDPNLKDTNPFIMVHMALLFLSVKGQKGSKPQFDNMIEYVDAVKQNLLKGTAHE